MSETIKTGLLRHTWSRARQPETGSIARVLEIEDACRARFKAAARMEPEQFARMATSGLPAITKAAIRYDPKEGQFKFSYSGEMFSDSYGLNFASGIVTQGSIQNFKADRTTGRRIFGLRVMNAASMGFRILGLAAADMMGGYIWARAGAYVEKTERRFLSERLQRRLSEIRHLLPEEVYTQAQALIALKAQTDLKRIADLSTRIERADIWWDGVRNQENKFQSRPHAYYVSRGFLPADGSMTLGQFLLCGMYYHAYVDLKDKVQLAQVAQYTGVKMRRPSLAARIKNILH